MGEIYQCFLERLHSRWPGFLYAREEHLRQDGLCGEAAEKVTENILADLFAMALDWKLGDLNPQVGQANLLLTTFGLKRLVIGTKRPRALLWSRKAIDSAIDQVTRLAAQHSVKRIAVSDGFILYAADCENGSIKDRVFLRLDDKEAPDALWWLSVNGVYTRTPDGHDATIQLYHDDGSSDLEAGTTAGAEEEISDKKYKVTTRCFAYVRDPKNYKS